MGLLSRASPKFKNDINVPPTHGLVWTQLVNGSPIKMVSVSQALFNSDVLVQFIEFHQISLQQGLKPITRLLMQF